MTNQEYTPEQIAAIKEPIDYKGPNGEHYSAHPDKYFSKKGFGNTVGKDLTKEKMIAVHVTNTFPEDGIIHPVNHYDPLIWRFSVHFSMNHPVGGHAYGNWDDKNHAILIPFEKIEDKTAYFTSVDSFTLGDLEIPTGSHILTRDENGSIEKTVYQKIKDEGYVVVDSGAWNWRHGDEWSPQDFDHF